MSFNNPFPDDAIWRGKTPPDYVSVFAWRQRQILAMRSNPVILAGALEYYRTHPVEFIEHFCDTYDPRLAGTTRPAKMPFILFQRQRELVEFFYHGIQAETNMLVEKCRDMGATWLAAAVSFHLWRFLPGSAIGWGSRKQDLVDKLGDPDSIFEKIRLLVTSVPNLFWPVGFDPTAHMPFMRIVNPQNGSTITGESGDNIGRGGRKLVYWKDEAQPLTARILTPSGWRTMGDMRVGSMVIGPDGLPRTVTNINDAGDHPVYRISFTDGTSVECSPNHLWTVIGRKTETIRTHEIAERYRYKSPGGQVQYRFRVPVTSPVHFSPGLPLPLDPYVTGVLIGDGSTNSGGVSFTSADEQIVANVAARLPVGCGVRKGSNYGYRIVDERGRMGNKPHNQSRARKTTRLAGLYGKVSYEKFIPDVYKFASVMDRVELLQGLMDTDGSASGGTVTYHTSSRRLADDVRFVVQSLGGAASLNVKPDHRGYRDMYCLHISLPTDIVPFKLDRKIRQIKKRNRSFGRTICNVELLDIHPVRCITVDAPDGLYLTDHCIVTHNSSHYERPEKIEAALADNTRVQIDISSVNGVGNVFHRRRKAGIDWTPGTVMLPGKTYVFVMDWRTHPEKDQAWYDARRQKAADEGLLHVFAQEVERNYSASVEGRIIDPAWIAAAVDAHVKLGFGDEGPCIAALDVADEGGDKNAIALRKGPILRHAEAWGEGDTGLTARRAVSVLRDRRHVPVRLQYDSVGVGAGVKAETNRLVTEGIMPVGVVMVPWNAGAGPLFPEARMIRGDPKSMINKDYFSGLKAQGWFQLARRFERTYRAVKEGRQYDPGELISIPSNLPCLPQLEQELAQVTQSQSTKTLKMVVNKSPEGTMSPNLADAVMMAYWPIVSGVTYSSENVG